METSGISHSSCQTVQSFVTNDHQALNETQTLYILTVLMRNLRATFTAVCTMLMSLHEECCYCTEFTSCLRLSTHRILLAAFDPAYSSACIEYILLICRWEAQLPSILLFQVKPLHLRLSVKKMTKSSKLQHIDMLCSYTYIVRVYVYVLYWETYLM